MLSMVARHIIITNLIAVNIVANAGFVKRLFLRPE